MSIVWEGRFVAVSMTDLAKESSQLAAILDDDICPAVIAIACEACAEIAQAHGYRLHHHFHPRRGQVFAVFERT